ncbi:MAG: transporter, partial [Chloroflexi bacterium]|nr:transporter [Chloroflexota bacterium]
MNLSSRVERAHGPRSLTFAALLLVFSILACNFPGMAGSTEGSSVGGVTPDATVIVTTATSQPTLPPPTAVPTIAYTPEWEPSSCNFPVPGGYNVDCGYLIVPEDRSDPETRDIRLHVAIFRSSSPTPAPDPILHLSGGPGSSGLGLASYTLSSGSAAFLAQRDYIIFDQRGTGFSDPSLSCPERDNLNVDLLERDPPPDEADTLIR